MSLLFLLSVLLATLLVAAVPVPRTTDPTQWFTVEWDTPEFVAMSGNFVVPDASGNGGIASVWPGLQGDNGVLQAELDSQSDAWTLGNSFYGTPSPSLGTRFGVSPGDTIHFSFTRTFAPGSWTGTLSGPHSTTQTFSLSGNMMNRAILAVALTGVPHDFTVAYSNVVIAAAASPAAEWCANAGLRGYNTGVGGSMVKDAVADGTTCRIGQVVMPGTA